MVYMYVEEAVREFVRGEVDGLYQQDVEIDVEVENCQFGLI